MRWFKNEQTIMPRDFLEKLAFIMDGLSRPKSSRFYSAVPIVMWVCLILPVFFPESSVDIIGLFFVVATSFVVLGVCLARGWVLQKNLMYFAVLSLILFGVKLIGLLNPAGTFEIEMLRYPLYVLAIAALFLVFAGGMLRLSARLIATVHCICLSLCLILHVAGLLELNHRNTAAGVLLFMGTASAYLCCELICNQRHGVSYKINPMWLLLLNVAFTVILVCETRSRTALFTLGIIVVSFGILRFLNPSPKAIRFSYFGLIICSAVALVMYFFSTEMPWYDAINSISNQLFGKNIDSSRSYLWQTAFDQLDGHFLFGLGTGTLPLGRYDGSSYHNSFLQIIMRNGVIGLALLLAMLYVVWKQLSEYGDDKCTLFAIAAFAGIIIYNCFECTLLDNKLSIGCIEWLFLAVASFRASSLQIQSELSKKRNRRRR